MGEQDPGDRVDAAADLLSEIRSNRSAADDETIAAVDDRVEALLSLFGRTHALSIMRLFAVEGGPWRFTEFEERIDASPNTLSKRLTELEEAGLIERQAYDENPPRVEYTWTAAAADLSLAIEGLYRWALEHDLDRTTVDSGTGDEVRGDEETDDG